MYNDIKVGTKKLLETRYYTENAHAFLFSGKYKKLRTLPTKDKKCVQVVYQKISITHFEIRIAIN